MKKTMNTQSINQPTRNYGIDLLKILAMFMITILHTQGHGGILWGGKLTFDQAHFFSSNYAWAWGLEILCYGATNCYAMISGYVNWKNPIRYEKIVNLWVQVVFYTLSITMAYSWINNVTPVHWFRAFFPVMTYQYWYITAYFGLYLFMPILNKYLQQISDKQLYLHMGLIFIFTSLLPTFIGGDPFILNAGYSTLWIIVMYLFGATLSRIQSASVPVSGLLLWFSLLILGTWYYKMRIDYANIWNNAELSMPNLVDYRSPSIVLASALLLFCFAKIKIKRLFLGKTIVLIANATLGIYLIHEHPLIRENFIVNYAMQFANKPTLTMVLSIFSGALSIFFICLMIEILRRFLFKLLAINLFIKKVAEKIITKFSY